jgi:hypothetical protein
MATGKQGNPTPPWETRRGSSRFNGIKWDGGDTPAFVISRHGIEQLDKFGASLVVERKQPIFVGIDSDEVRLEAVHISQGITAFRVSFLDQTASPFERFVRPATSETYQEHVSCPTVPACIVLGTRFTTAALVTLGKAGAFVIDRITLQGQSLGTFSAVWKWYRGHPSGNTQALPPLHPKELSDDEYATLTGYPPGVKPSDLQEELDRANED